MGGRQQGGELQEGGRASHESFGGGWGAAGEGGRGATCGQGGAKSFQSTETILDL